MSTTPRRDGRHIVKIEKACTLPFPVARVYAAWISQSTIIPPATRMEIDARVGAHYRLILESPDYTARAEGIFKIVEPENRLVYSWEWNGDGEVSEIAVTFREQSGETGIRLVHSGFEKPESAAMHDTGWDAYFSGLRDHLQRL